MKPEIFVNKKVWQKFTPEEMVEYKQKVFDHYQANGFPYFNMTNEQCLTKFKKLVEYDTSKLIIGDELNQTMLGLDIANTWMPHLFGVRCRSFRSPLDAFEDPDILKKAIDKRIQLGDNMSDAGMRKALSWVSGTHKVSNFRPTIAKFIYDNYAGDGHVLDFSCGFGGRLLGAMASDKVKFYHGTDPCDQTAFVLENMAYTFKNGKGAWIDNVPFEDLNLHNHQYDLAFSSPPYFDTEHYSYEANQSWVRYKTRDMWREGFLVPTIEKCYKHVKTGGYFVINVADVASFKNLEATVIHEAQAVGFVLEHTWRMRLSSLMGSGFKYEPIFVFKKPNYGEV